MIVSLLITGKLGKQSKLVFHLCNSKNSETDMSYLRSFWRLLLYRRTGQTIVYEWG